MTILLPVDAAYALDYLSILLVKQDSGLDVADEIERIETFLRVQMPNLTEIKISMAFKRLMVANQQTFEAIELAHKNEITARKVQEINYSRYRAKQRLQAEFWPNHALEERKTELQ